MTEKSGAPTVTTAEPPKGRPSIYNHELGERIKAELSTGKSLNAICKEAWAPDKTTVLSWALNAQHPFSHQYAHGRRMQAEHFIDEIMGIADSPTDGETAQCARLAVDTRKWVACKVLPKIYGDRKVIQGDEAADPIRVDLMPAMTKDAALKLLDERRKKKDN